VKGRLTLESIRALQKQPGLPCSVGEFIKTLPKPDRKVLVKALADLTIDARSIWRAMRKIGYQRGRIRVEVHRKGECRCPRKP